MGSKFFGNQEKNQILAHLERFLRGPMRYNLKIDPLGIHFEISESVQRPQRITNQEQFSNELHGMSNKERRLFNLKRRRSKPKIRSVKRGRMVSLKGSFNF
jgi:hypothetical protein